MRERALISAFRRWPISGAVCDGLRPLHALIEAHVLGAERLHGDDTTVTILAKGKTEIGRVWVYVRDDKPFGGAAPQQLSSMPPATEPVSIPSGIWRSLPDSCRPTPMTVTQTLSSRSQARSITEALCWSHARRKFSNWPISPQMRDEERMRAISPIAFEAVKRIDALFDIEREINGLTSEQRLAVREERSVR